MWLFVAVITLFNKTIFRRMFTREIRVYSKEKLVSITDIYQFIQILTNAASENNNAFCSHIFEKIVGLKKQSCNNKSIKMFFFDVCRPEF